MLRAISRKNYSFISLLLVFNLLSVLPSPQIMKVQSNTGTGLNKTVSFGGLPKFYKPPNTFLNQRTQSAQSESNSPDVTIYFVSKNGDNSDPTKGFKTGFQSLQDAIITAVFSDGGEIWVAAGVYYPDEGGVQIDNNPNETFYLADTIQLYGGFDKDDKDFSERDWFNNLTVLSGDIDKNDDDDSKGVVSDPSNINGSNAYHVVSAKNVNSSAILDGFTITAGQADGSVAPDNNGGGFYCDGSGEDRVCGPTVRNVTFTGNTANLGGGIYSDGYNKGSSKPLLIDVNFSGNTAGYGGAIYNNGSFGDSSPSLERVTFTGNSATQKGGAMYNDGSLGISSPNLFYVTFSNNKAGERGGAIYNDGSNVGISSPSSTNVTFNKNEADQRGGAIYNDGSSSGKSSPSFWDAIFSNNMAGENGGAIYNDAITSGTSSPGFNNATFSRNSAQNNGGAMYNNGRVNGQSNPILLNVTFFANYAGIHGGAVYNNGDAGECSPSFTNVIFSGNKADQRGGAVFNEGTFTGYSKPSFLNVTLSGNNAGTYGGALANYGYDGVCNPDFRNSIVWNNHDSSGNGKLGANIFNEDARVTLAYSILQGAGDSSNWISDWRYEDAGSNIDTDPLFRLDIKPTDAPTSAGDLRLQMGSPAVDSGQNSFISGIVYDPDGALRKVDGDGDGHITVDRGAYERQIYIYLPMVMSRRE